MEMHGGFRHARRAGREAKQRNIVAAGLHSVKIHRLIKRCAVKLGIMIGSPVEADNALEKSAVGSAGFHFFHQPGVAQG